MSVLEQMRSGSDSTGMQFMMALVVLSFVGWYAMPTGDMTNVVAEVNGEKIMGTEWGRLYRQTERRQEVMRGGTLSDQEQKLLGETVKQTLADQAVLLQQADRLGIFVSDTEVAWQIFKDPSFQDQDGEFSEDLFERTLKYGQYTRDDFEGRLRDDIVRRRLMSLISMGATVSSADVERTYRDAETKINLSYVRVRPSVFRDDVTLSDDERAAWLVENEAEAREVYDTDLTRVYSHPRQVQLSMIRLTETPDGPAIDELKASLTQLREQLVEGADFAAMAREHSKDSTATNGGDLGMRAEQQLMSEVLGAIEGLEDGGLSRVITVDGTEARLYKVVQRKAAYVDAFEDVRDDIVTQIVREERLPELAAAFAESEVLAAWARDGEAPSELLEGKSLAVLQTGSIGLGGSFGYSAPPEDMLAAAADAEPGSVLADVYEKDGEYWVGALDTRSEPDMGAFEDKREMLTEQTLAMKRQALWQSWVDDAKANADIRIY